MLIRYGTGKNGKRKKVAHIYVKEEHKISGNKIDRDAAKITARITAAGFEAYVVGGAVRDLLLGKIPKDFDIATDASPKQVKKLFWNSRIIGRRFRLVHIHFPGKIIEVSTFRSDSSDGGNVYGTIEEDVKRRDFSVNALYYSPQTEYIIDFVDGYKDIKAGKIRSLLPLNSTFLDDPVRMIRAVKYSAVTGFKISFLVRRSIQRYSGELKRCPSSRMTEEVFKILQSGYSAEIVEKLIHYRLFQYILPVLDALVHRNKINRHNGTRKVRTDFINSLRALDDAVREKGENRKGRMLAYIIQPFYFFPEDFDNTIDLFRDTFKEIKRLIEPITPPNQEVEMAAVKLFRDEKIPPPKMVSRKRKPKPLPPHQKKGKLHHHPHHGKKSRPEKE